MKATSGGACSERSKLDVGSLRTLQKGKKADASKKQLEGNLRRAKNEITEALAAHGFEVRDEWIQVNEYQDLIFEDIEVGRGAVHVRRRPGGSFAVRHFLEDEDLNPLIWDRDFAGLEAFVDEIEIWMHDMVIPCPECNGTRKRVLNGATYRCSTCGGDGEIYRHSLP